MLTKLEIRNFKAFGDHTAFELRPLTIFLGSNSSGKTSVLEAIGLLSQSAPRAEQKPQLKWRDQLVDLGPTGMSAVHKLDQELHFWAALEIEAGEHFRNWLRPREDESGGAAQTLGYGIGHRPGTEEWKHELSINHKVVASNSTIRLGRGLRQTGHGSVLECDFLPPSERVFEPAASGDAALAPKLFVGTKAVGGKEVDEVSHRKFVQFGLYTSFIGAYLRQRVFMVGPSRIPRREAPEIEAGPLAVGRQGERTITVLSVIFSHARHSAQARKIQTWAEVFGMSSLTAGWVREEFLHAGYLDSCCEAPMSIESAGAGAQQILPVITQIFSAPKNSAILIEEPEAGLHPEAQAEVAKMFADALERGQQLLVATHSEALLKALAEISKKTNLLRDDDVAIYRLSKTPSGVKTERLSLETAKSTSEPDARSFATA